MTDLRTDDETASNQDPVDEPSTGGNEALRLEVKALIREREREGVRGLATRLGPTEWAEIVPRLDPGEIAVLLRWLPDDEIPQPLEALPPDEAARILRSLPSPEAAALLAQRDPD